MKQGPLQKCTPQASHLFLDLMCVAASGLLAVYFALLACETTV